MVKNKNTHPNVDLRVGWFDDYPTETKIYHALFNTLVKKCRRNENVAWKDAFMYYNCSKWHDYVMLKVLPYTRF